MATSLVYLLPAPTGRKKDSVSFQRSKLGGVDYELRWHWNQRAGAWYLDLYNADGGALCLGRRVVCNVSLWARRASDEMPAGQLIAYDGSERPSDPGLFDLGGRVKVVWLEDVD